MYRHVVGAAVWCGLAMAIGITGCSLTSEPVGRLDLSVSLSTTEVNADSGALVRVIAVNPGPAVVSLETLGGCVVAHRILGPDGESFRGGYGYGCRSSLKVVNVLPGDSVVRVFTLDARPFRSSPGTGRWPAGTYQVVGLLLGRHGDVIDETSPIEFRLTCHDPTWPEC